MGPARPAHTELGRALCTLALCLLCAAAEAQGLLPYSWDEFVTLYAERRADWQDEGEEDTDEWLAELTLLHERPIDLNNSTREQLLQIPTITPAAAEQIHAYVFQFGPVESMGELRLIPGLSPETLRVLPLFARLGSYTTLWSRARPPRWRGSAELRTDIPLYRRRGYTATPGYAGNPLRHLLRAHTTKGRYELGLRMEKDPGETYPDSYGGYAMIDNTVSEPHAGRLLQRLVAGDFRANFGQGLVMGAGSRWDPSSLATSSSQGLRPMRGNDEYRFLRGAGATIHRATPAGHFALTALASCRALDATLDHNGHVLTTRRDGMHRSEAERAAAGAFLMTTTAAHLAWTRGHYSLGLTAAWQHTGTPLDPGDAPYRQIYPRGTDLGQASLCYALPLHPLRLAGEVAWDALGGGWAMVHRLVFQPSQDLEIALTPWRYGSHYSAPLAAAPVLSGETPQNEHGAALHTSWFIGRGFLIRALAQAAHHPWPRYGFTGSDTQYRLHGELEHIPKRGHRLALTYRWRHGMERGDLLRTHHQARLQWRWTPTRTHTLLTALMSHTTDGLTGWGASCRWTMESPDEQWQTIAALNYCNTPDFLHSLWAYEPSLTGAMSGGTLYGHALRAAAKARWKAPSGRWMFEAKLAATRYLDTDTHGSGLQQLVTFLKADIGLLARFSW